MGYEQFEKLCEEKGVKPYHVSVATGISTATLSSWKKGKYTPKKDKLEKIADYFGTTVDRLEGKDQEEGQTELYYVNEETAKIAQQVFENPKLRVLFDAAVDSKPEDIQLAADMLLRFKETNSDG